MQDRSTVIPVEVRRHAAFTLVEVMLVVAILSVLLFVAIPSYQGYVERAEASAAEADILEISVTLDLFFENNGFFPDSLEEIGFNGMKDPWGNPYRYLNIATVIGKGKLRKDKNLVPINTDYDLYSMGPDGASVGPLTAKASRDDIIRANNGQFIGQAAKY